MPPANRHAPRRAKSSTSDYSEGFFGNLKTGMRGTYKQVSKKWLQSYLDEYAWRYNQRHRGSRSMFHLLVNEAASR